MPTKTFAPFGARPSNALTPKPDSQAETDASAYMYKLLAHGGPNLKESGGYEALCHALSVLYNAAGGSANLVDLCLLYPWANLAGPTVITLKGSAPTTLVGSPSYTRNGLVFDGVGVAGKFTLPAALATGTGGSVAWTWRSVRAGVGGSGDTILALTNGSNSYTAGSMLYAWRNGNYQTNIYTRSASTTAARPLATFDAQGNTAWGGNGSLKPVKAPGVYAADPRPHSILWANNNAATPLCNLWVDGLVTDSCATSTQQSPVSMDRLSIGARPTGASSWDLYAQGTMGAWAVFSNTGWTDDQARGVDVALGLLDPAYRNDCVCVIGDSTAGNLYTNQRDNFPDQFLTLIGEPDLPLYNYAVSGTLAQNHASDVWTWLRGRAGQFSRVNVIVASGINDLILSNRTSTQLLTDLRTIWAAAKALGCVVHACTLTPLNGSGYYSTQRNTYRLETNAGIIAALASGLVDYVHDFASIPELSDATNTTYYSDNLHRTAAGNALCAAKLAALGSWTWKQ